MQRTRELLRSSALLQEDKGVVALFYLEQRISIVLPTESPARYLPLYLFSYELSLTSFNLLQHRYLPRNIVPMKFPSSAWLCTHNVLSVSFAHRDYRVESSRLQYEALRDEPRGETSEGDCLVCRDRRCERGIWDGIFFGS